MRDEIRIGVKTKFTIGKFKDSDGAVAAMSRAGATTKELEALFSDRHLGTEEFFKNGALNEGLQAIIDQICGLATPTKWDNTNARVEVGNGTAAFAATQTALQGASKAYSTMDGGYPQRSGQIGKWKGTFASGQAEFAWEEYSVCNSGDDSTGLNLNRKVESKGTKAAGETWTLEIDVTFS